MERRAVATVLSVLPTQREIAKHPPSTDGCLEPALLATRVDLPAACNQSLWQILPLRGAHRCRILPLSSACASAVWLSLDPEASAFERGNATTKNNILCNRNSHLLCREGHAYRLLLPRRPLPFVSLHILWRMIPLHPSLSAAARLTQLQGSLTPPPLGAATYLLHAWGIHADWNHRAEASVHPLMRRSTSTGEKRTTRRLWCLHSTGWTPSNLKPIH